MLSKVLKGGAALQIRTMAFSDVANGPRSSARSHSVDRSGENQDRRILLEKIHVLEAGLSSAQKDAFESGYRKGEQAAREALTPVLARLTASISEVIGLRPELRRRAEKDAVELALKIAARVLHRELSIDNSALNALAGVVFSRMARSESWQLTVHPQFADVIRDALPGGSAERVRVDADPSCAPGTVIARSSDGVVDASVDSQLAEISRGLADRLISK